MLFTLILTQNFSNICTNNVWDLELKHSLTQVKACLSWLTHTFYVVMTLLLETERATTKPSIGLAPHSSDIKFCVHPCNLHDNQNSGQVCEVVRFVTRIASDQSFQVSIAHTLLRARESSQNFALGSDHHAPSIWAVGKLWLKFCQLPVLEFYD